MADEDFDPKGVVEEVLETLEEWNEAIAAEEQPPIHYRVVQGTDPAPLSQNNTEDEKQIQLIDGLQMYRVATRNDNPTLSWFDCFLFQLNEQYRTLRFETQLEIQQAFREYCKTRAEDIQDAFPEEWAEIFDLNVSMASLYEDDSVITHKLGFILGWFFGVVTIILEFADSTEAFIPAVETVYQSAECPVVVMIGYDGEHTGTYEPLCELTKETTGYRAFSLEPYFTWENPVLCELKELANQVPELFEADDIPAHVEQWTEPSCEKPYLLPVLIPEGDPLDNWGQIDGWIQTYVAEQKMKLLGKEVTTPEQKSSSYFLAELSGEDELSKRQQAELTAHKWHTIVTVGDGTCFLHAAIQAISPTYRRLSPADRSKVGKAFRILEVLKLFDDLADISLVGNPSLFLEESHIRRFLSQYKINALVVTRDDGGTRLTPLVSEEKALNGFPWIFMFNSDQSHYSCIAVTYKKAVRLMLTEPQYFEEYPAITKNWLRDSQYVQLRGNLIHSIEASGANAELKQEIRSNIFKHELDARKATENVGTLPGKLNGYEAMLGLKKGSFTRFKKPFAALAAQKGGRKTRRKHIPE